MRTSSLPGRIHQRARWPRSRWKGGSNGFASDVIDDWYQAETNGPGGRSLAGPHRETPEEAHADAQAMLDGTYLVGGTDAREPSLEARVVLYQPSLKISIHEDLTPKPCSHVPTVAVAPLDVEAACGVDIMVSIPHVSGASPASEGRVVVSSGGIDVLALSHHNPEGVALALRALLAQAYAAGSAVPCDDIHGGD